MEHYLDHDTHLMPSSTFEALKKLRKNGIRLFVATGRPPNNLKVIQDCFRVRWFSHK
ncbi:MAG: HAD hydrolase family protein [Thomasclavelia ramosa]